MKIYNYVNLRWASGFDRVSDAHREIVPRIEDFLNSLNGQDSEPGVYSLWDLQMRIYIGAIVVRSSVIVKRPDGAENCTPADYVHAIAITGSSKKPLDDAWLTGLFQHQYSENLQESIARFHSELSTQEKSEGRDVVEQKFITEVAVKGVRKGQLSSSAPRQSSPSEASSLPQNSNPGGDQESIEILRSSRSTKPEKLREPNRDSESLALHSVSTHWQSPGSFAFNTLALVCAINFLAVIVLWANTRISSDIETRIGKIESVLREIQKDASSTEEATGAVSSNVGGNNSNAEIVSDRAENKSVDD